MYDSSPAPLSGIVVVDFTTLAPGPLATLMLASAGAEVIKVERPGFGDEMRIYEKAFGDDGVTFSILNAGKRSVVADLKNKDDLNKIKNLIKRSDIVIEQFRPGVMKKLGLAYEDLKASNPGLIYCSITGFGQHGPKSSVAAHDLNYVADAGMLTIGETRAGGPAIPPLLAADLAAGSYPAVMNILLALQQRNQTEKGSYIDISMTDCLFPLMFWALGLGWGANSWANDGGRLLTGGSPRYQVYRTSDDRFLAVAALEDRFWKNFCNAIELDRSRLDEVNHPREVIRAVGQRIQAKSSAQWRKIFEKRDACAVVANTLEEAVQDDHYLERGLFDQKIQNESGSLVNALPLPIVPELQSSRSSPKKVPSLGEHNKILDP